MLSPLLVEVGLRACRLPDKMHRAHMGYMTTIITVIVTRVQSLVRRPAWKTAYGRLACLHKPVILTSGPTGVMLACGRLQWSTITGPHTSLVIYECSYRYGWLDEQLESTLHADDAITYGQASTRRVIPVDYIRVLVTMHMAIATLKR
jgi:hypothetical protein